MLSGRNTATALEAAIDALRRAEQDLREAAAKAAAGGDYDDVVVITRWAKTVQSLIAEDRGRIIQLVPTNVPLPAEGGRQPYRNGPKPMAPGKVTAGATVYSRESDFLIKTARGRKSRKSYEHRAPYEVVLIVAECLAEWRSNRKLTTAEELLTAYTKRKGSVVSYQVYVVLGWLVQIGLARRHGRTGYSVPSPTTMVDDVRKAWADIVDTTNQAANIAG